MVQRCQSPPPMVMGQTIPPPPPPVVVVLWLGWCGFIYMFTDVRDFNMCGEMPQPYIPLRGVPVCLRGFGFREMVGGLFHRCKKKIVGLSQELETSSCLLHVGKGC